MSDDRISLPWSTIFVSALVGAVLWVTIIFAAAAVLADHVPPAEPIDSATLEVWEYPAGEHMACDGSTYTVGFHRLHWGVFTTKASPNPSEHWDWRYVPTITEGGVRRPGDDSGSRHTNHPPHQIVVQAHSGDTFATRGVPATVEIDATLRGQETGDTHQFACTFVYQP